MLGLLLGTADDSRNRTALKADELASALLGLLSNPAECWRLGENCRRVSNNFIWPLIVQRFEEAYYRSLDGRMRG